MFLICFAFVSSHIMNATDVNPLFYSALLLSALPVPLLRQVYDGKRNFIQNVVSLFKAVVDSDHIF